MSVFKMTVALALVVLAAEEGTAERAFVTVGGGGREWADLAQRWVALDDTTAPGAIQPKELQTWENIIAGEGELVNIFGFGWHRGKTGIEAVGKELGLHPRIWSANDSRTVNEVIDGDSTTFKTQVLLVYQDEYNQYTTATSSGTETGIMLVNNEVHTLDLGIEVPVDRIRFYPPQKGVDRRGVPNRDTSPQGFELSVARYPQDFLILGTEVYPWHALDLVVDRTLANSRSIVDAALPLQFVRFVRLNLALMRQAYSLAEIEVYGKGVPSRASFTSTAIDFGEPVNFGEIRYAFSRLRRGADGELREDPQAPARLVLETKTGIDDTPRSYYVVDELGRDVEVTQREHQLADPPRIDRTGLRLPGMQGAITEDRNQWTPWSSPYERSGEQNRSADGRRYLQFQFALETDDPLAFVRLDSLSFEYSPLLVGAVVGEISLAEEPSKPVVEVAAGVEHLFAYDIRAAFDAPSQNGFDGVRLDVPPGSRFLGLEIGDVLAPATPDSVRQEETEISVFFSSHKISGETNQPVRILLSAPLLNSNTFFTGDIFDTQSDNLPQSIGAGDARAEVGANSLQVFASQARLEILADVAVAPAVVTPNGDGANDRAEIGFKILGIERGQVEVEIFALSGRRVKTLFSEFRGQGIYAVAWDGTDDHEVLLQPGIYLCRVTVETESGTSEIIRPVSVAY